MFKSINIFIIYAASVIFFTFLIIEYVSVNIQSSAFYASGGITTLLYMAMKGYIKF